MVPPVDADPNAPIAAWLRSTRVRQTMDDGEGGLKPWTVDHFLALMKAEVGWAPARPNYSKYERGRAVPQPKTLARFVEFWAGHGEPGPDLTPPAPQQDPLIAALDRQSRAMEGLVDLLRQVVAGQGRRLEEVEVVLRHLVAPTTQDTAALPAPRQTAGSPR